MTERLLTADFAKASEKIIKNLRFIDYLQQAPQKYHNLEFETLKPGNSVRLDLGGLNTFTGRVWLIDYRPAAMEILAVRRDIYTRAFLAQKWSINKTGDWLLKGGLSQVILSINQGVSLRREEGEVVWRIDLPRLDQSLLDYLRTLFYS